MTRPSAIFTLNPNKTTSSNGPTTVLSSVLRPQTTGKDGIKQIDLVTESISGLDNDVKDDNISIGKTPKSITVARTNGYISSITDGTTTWTFDRTDNYITSITISQN